MHLILASLEERGRREKKKKSPSLSFHVTRLNSLHLQLNRRNTSTSSTLLWGSTYTDHQSLRTLEYNPKITSQMQFQPQPQMTGITCHTPEPRDREAEAPELIRRDPFGSTAPVQEPGDIDPPPDVIAAVPDPNQVDRGALQLPSPSQSLDQLLLLGHKYYDSLFENRAQSRRTLHSEVQKLQMFFYHIIHGQALLALDPAKHTQTRPLRTSTPCLTWYADFWRAERCSLSPVCLLLFCCLPAWKASARLSAICFCLHL